jgi:hypothetical protein
MLIPLILTVILANASPTPSTASTSSTVVPSATPDVSLLTARFTAFFTEVLAGKAPAQGLTDKMQSALTPDVLSKLSAYYGTLGKFERLTFKAEDEVQGFQRYHYTAVFSNGSSGVLFVVDSDGKIAGFFNEP